MNIIEENISLKQNQNIFFIKETKEKVKRNKLNMCNNDICI